jgi:hypothetical protein
MTVRSFTNMAMGLPFDPPSLPGLPQPYRITVV